MCPARYIIYIFYIAFGFGSKLFIFVLSDHVLKMLLELLNIPQCI